jgi:molybdate transport system substrate-binding protein
MIWMRQKTLIILVTLVTLAASPTRAAEIVLFAAASLSDCLQAIAVDYKRQSGNTLVFNFAASGVLARQIEEGAPADIFFSADEARMDWLEKKGLIVNETRQSRLSNRLVIVCPTDSHVSITNISGLISPSITRLALGNPKTVPVGSYAQAYLTKQALWTLLESKVVPCESARAVLAAVESGNVDAGIVYKTDAALSRKVRLVFEVPAQESPRITYPVALLRDAKRGQAARTFLAHLAGPDAAAVFTRHGFMVLAAPQRE